jgi:hypothetical protein
MSKLLAVLLATAFPLVLGSELADDKTSSFDHGSDPYGATPARTPKGTPLVGDFNGKDRQRAITPDFGRAKDRQRAMTPEEKAAAKKAKRVERQKELSTESERQKALTDQSKKGPGQ